MQAANNTKPVKKALSALAISKMKPGDPVKSDIGENAGLRVTCGKGGIPTFFYRYRSPITNGLVQIKIGKFRKGDNLEGVSLNEARIELQKLKSIRNTGLCPKTEIAKEKLRREQDLKDLERQQVKDRFTVKDLVDLYLTEYIEDRWVEDGRSEGKMVRKKGARQPKGQQETRRTLYGDAVRALGDMPAAKVTRPMVVNLVQDIIKTRGANVQAGSVLRELSSAYDFAIGLNYFEEDFANPALLAKASLRQAKVKLTPEKGKRYLGDRELSKMLSWLPGSGFSTTQKNVFRFTLWTGCRTGEVCEAKWEDVDLEKGIWHMKDSKNGAAREVQLSHQAIHFLEHLQLTTDKYLFPSTRTKEPIQQKSLSETKWHLKNPDKLKNRQSFRPEQLWLDDMDDWSPHDLRRTVRTGLARLGCPSDVAEAVLGHSKKGIQGTYDLHTYDAECKIWLQKWADHMDRLIGK